MMNRLTNYRSEQSSVHNHQSMDKWKVPTTKVKILPATAIGLLKRFRKFYKVFSRENTSIQRNELVSILDEMYRQNVIDLIEYRQINNKLTKSMGSGFEESLVDAENQSIGENSKICTQISLHKGGLYLAYVSLLMK